MNIPTEEERQKMIAENKKRVLSILEPISVTPIEATDVRFRFSYRGMWIDCVSQTFPAERLFVTMHRMPKDPEEKSLLENAGQILHKDPRRKKEFEEKYLYEYFMLEMPTEEALREVLWKVKEKESKL